MGSISIALHSLKNSTDQPTATSSPTPTHTHPLETPGSGLVSRLEAFLSTFVDDPKPQKETVSLGDRARIIQQLEQAFEFFKQGFEVSGFKAICISSLHAVDCGVFVGYNCSYPTHGCPLWTTCEQHTTVTAR